MGGSGARPVDGRSGRAASARASSREGAPVQEGGQRREGMSAASRGRGGGGGQQREIGDVPESFPAERVVRRAG